MNRLTPFHLAIQVRDIAEARDFYGTKLGFREGRSDSTWIDFDFFGHQVVTHLNPELGPEGRVPSHRNPVDRHAVPVPHFGVVLSTPEWQNLAERYGGWLKEMLICVLRESGAPVKYWCYGIWTQCYLSQAESFLQHPYLIGFLHSVQCPNWDEKDP